MKQEQKTMTGYPSIDKPWLKYYSQEAIDATLPDCTIYEHIFRCNQDNLDRIALNYYGAKIGYGKMFKNISLLSGALERIGVKEGDVVTIAMINSPETIYLLFALNKLGAVANMVYGSSTEDELKKYLLDLQSTIVFTLDLFQDKFAHIADETGLTRVIVASLTQSMSSINRFGARYLKDMKPIPMPEDARFVSWKEFTRQHIPSEIIRGNGTSPAAITYTGGTTGGSKGAVLSNKAILAVVEQYAIGEKELARENTWAQVLPLFISYGLVSFLLPLKIGMRLIVRIPMTESIADLYRKYKPNHIIYGPAYWEGFADENKELDLSDLIAPISGGDMLHAATEEKINRYLESHHCAYPLMNGYGMTEVGAAVSVNFQYAHQFGSVGIPFVKNVIAAFDVETGEELPYGQQGELCIQAPSMMTEYVNAPEETNNIIRRHDDGQLWVHSGDLGHISEDGFVYISGRLKRYLLHIANGVQKKVFSLDVEKVLLKHPKVENCAVVPMPDPDTFQVPAAFIILKKEYRGEKGLADELAAYGKERLTDAYRPARYIFVDQFPLTKVGKVDYLKLEQMAADEQG